MCTAARECVKRSDTPAALVAQVHFREPPIVVNLTLVDRARAMQASGDECRCAVGSDVQEYAYETSS